MSDYEPQMIDITTQGSSHRVYIVRDYRGREWKARGDRLMSEMDWWLMHEWRNRTLQLKNRRAKVSAIINTVPAWRPFLRRKLKRRMDSRFDRTWKIPGTNMYFREFDRIKNPVLELPPLPSWSDLMNPDRRY